MTANVYAHTPLTRTSTLKAGGKPSYDCFYAVRIGNIKLVEHLVKTGACKVTATRWSSCTWAPLRGTSSTF